MEARRPALEVRFAPELSPPAIGGTPTRPQILTQILLVATGAAFFVAFRVLQPFLAVLAWALALSVITVPLFARINGRLKKRDVASGVTVVLVAVCILLPLTFVVKAMLAQSLSGLQSVSVLTDTDELRDRFGRNSAIYKAIEWGRENVNSDEGIKTAVAAAQAQVTSVFAGSIMWIVQLLFVLFALFYFIRDREVLLSKLRALLPLTEAETSEIFDRVRDTLQATFYGSFITSAIQGALGGLMFWMLGLPAPIVWGAVMALLSLVPYFGAFLIWAPAALFLATDGHWAKATILALWGVFAIGMVDNLLYPTLVGNKLRFHTLAIFFFVLGGIAFFGASGIILGPLTLVLSDGLLEIWKRRLRRAS